MTVITTQAYTALPPKMRMNARWVVLFTNTYRPALEKIFEEQMSDWVSYEEMFVFLYQNTKDRQAIVLNNDPYAKEGCRVFISKADDVGFFPAGCDAAWGGPRYVMQRKQKKLMGEQHNKKYAKSTLARWMNAPKSVPTQEQLAGQNIQMQRMRHYDPFHYVR